MQGLSNWTIKDLAECLGVLPEVLHWEIQRNRLIATKSQPQEITALNALQYYQNYFGDGKPDLALEDEPDAAEIEAIDVLQAFWQKGSAAQKAIDQIVDDARRELE